MGKVMKIKTAALGLAIVLCSGCDMKERISRLEKENQELKATVEKNGAVVDYDLQAKCAKDARNWFNENWQRDKNTALLEFTNHYNKSQNKCFIFVEYHYSLFSAGSWTSNMSLWDVYENVKYAAFSEQHVIVSDSKTKPTDMMIQCEVRGEKCKTLDEFQKGISPYLNN